ncbi:galactokinase [Acrocarpospora corrugata]|uniref:Galactokinase n=1 Tax=Acrocarpospora corrugata TaxID=35763 RepID=A0A5M3W3A7_9ACTN|nr:galactokinase [Acrocarpospora corrugata]GES01773.1 galactokinase [Acrocarpospora corrugata]
MRVLDAFSETYDKSPEGIWYAPGRVNLIGEHTDYNDGLVLPFAVPWGVTLAASPREDTTIRLRSLQTGTQTVTTLEDAHGWARYPTGVFWALRRDGLPVRGADIVIDGDIPEGAGLSSSAALEVATAVALNDLYALALDPLDLARICQLAENDFAGAPCGIMDQATAALAREGHALLLDCRSLASRQIPFDLAAHGLELLIINTNVRHAVADGQYARRRQECENAAKRLGVPALRDVTDLAAALNRLDGEERKRTQHVVTENHRVEALIGLLRAGAVTEIGALLNASHLSLRDQFEVSCPELDVAVESALRGGARGARMTGGGFGGSAIALVATERADSVRTSVAAAYAERGWRAPTFLTATPAGGARRLDTHGQ